MKKNIFIIILLLLAVAAVGLAVQGKRTPSVGDTKTSNANTPTIEQGGLVIEDLDEALAEVEDLDLEYADPGLDFDVSY